MKRKLLIDTGHSEAFQGASKYKREVDWVRSIAEKLYPLLDTNFWDVIKVPDSYPGESSANDSLVKRIKWINDNSDSTDMLVSIHANSAAEPKPGKPEPRGVLTYYYSGSESSKAEALRLSNAYSTATGVPLFNGGLMGDLESRFKLPNGKPAGLGMIRQTQPVSLLIECGFVSSKEDMAIDPTLAARGIANYLNSFNHMPEQTPVPDELTKVLQELNKRQVIKDISNPHRPVTLAEVALIVYRNEHLPKLS